MRKMGVICINETDMVHSWQREAVDSASVRCETTADNCVLKMIRYTTSTLFSYDAN